MVKILTAHTSETDDVETAVSEILNQLDLSRLQKYSAGIMYYYADFAKTGVTKQICEKLPFPVIGSTTSSSAVHGSKKDITLTISVFTSDDIAFTAGICDLVGDEPYMPLEKLYKELVAQKPASFPAGEKPSMMYIIAPDFKDVTGDDYVAVLSGLSGGSPVFGSVAFIHTAEFIGIKTFFNGTEYDCSMPVLAFWGNLNPKFFISSVPDEQIIHKSAVITDSYRNRIKKVNGIPVLEYLETLGLARDGKLEGTDSFPLILHVGGGSRLVRSIIGVDKGEVLCSGAVPSHIPMGISFCDKDFVMESARKTAAECKRWLESQSNPESGAVHSGFALVVSCIGRRWMLGTDVYAEIQEIDAGLNKLPYHLVYSRGEYCPSGIINGKADNYFYNYSLCICII